MIYYGGYFMVRNKYLFQQLFSLVLVLVLYLLCAYVHLLGVWCVVGGINRIRNTGYG
jgi:hypothetical protein